MYALPIYYTRGAHLVGIASPTRPRGARKCALSETQRRSTRGMTIAQTLGSAAVVGHCTRIRGWHSLSPFAPPGRDAEISGQCVGGQGAIGRRRTFLRTFFAPGFVAAMTRARSIRRQDREGETDGLGSLASPRLESWRAGAGNDTTGVQRIVRRRHGHARNAGVEQRGREERSDVDGDRCAFRPVRRGRRTQDVREVRSRDELQALR